jgi:hypothetical protein
MLRTLGVEKQHDHRLLKARAQDANDKALAFPHNNYGETLKSQPSDT